MGSLHLMVGRDGETYARQRFEAMGYKVTIPPPRSKRGDLVVTNIETGQILKVEVKTSMEGVGRKWKVCLNKAKHTFVGHADLVVIQLVIRTGRVVSFFIPSEILLNKNTLTWRNPETPNSKWAQYRQADYRIFGGVG